MDLTIPKNIKTKKDRLEFLERIGEEARRWRESAEWVRAKAWMIIRDERLYEEHGIQSFQEYVKQHVRECRATVYAHINVVETFGDQEVFIKDNGIEFHRLLTGTELIRDEKTDTETVVEQASALRDDDWKDEVRKYKGLKSTIECDHKDHVEVTLCQCLGCAHKWSIKRESVYAALLRALDMIKQWQGEAAFDAYYRKSPEMEIIRKALR
jgi:hypothetical protein